jgi:hypothetical protein
MIVDLVPQSAHKVFEDHSTGLHGTPPAQLLYSLLVMADHSWRMSILHFELKMAIELVFCLYRCGGGSWQQCWCAGRGAGRGGCCTAG